MGNIFSLSKDLVESKRKLRERERIDLENQIQQLSPQECLVCKIRNESKQRRKERRDKQEIEYKKREKERETERKLAWWQQRLGPDVRIQRYEGESFMTTCDYVPNRINVEIKDGHVIQLSKG